MRVPFARDVGRIARPRAPAQRSLNELSAQWAERGIELAGLRATRDGTIADSARTVAVFGDTLAPDVIHRHHIPSALVQVVMEA